MTFEEWLEKTKKVLKVDTFNTVKCIECEKEGSPQYFQKIFDRGEGICKRCWNTIEDYE